MPGDELAHGGDQGIDPLPQVLIDFLNPLPQSCILCARLRGKLLDPLLQPSIALAQLIAEVRDLHAQLTNLPLRIPPQLLILPAILLPLFHRHRGNVLDALESLLGRHISIVQ